MKYQISLVDTDSIFFYKPDNSSFTKEERQKILDEINNQLPEYIKFSDNGYFRKMLVVKSKNYVMQSEDGKIKYKGSALIDTKREFKFRQFIKDFIQLLLEDKQSELVNLYNQYAKEIMNITDISLYSTKKTITQSVLNPERTNEQKVLDALAGEELVQEGDKIHVYYTLDGSLKLQKNWNNDHDPWKLLKRLYDTVCIFNKIVSKEKFLNYSLKKNRKLVEELN